MKIDIQETKLQKIKSGIANKLLGKDVSAQFARSFSETIEEIAVLLTDYPPSTPGNEPPYPFWNRGVGRVFASGKVDPFSQHYGGNPNAYSAEVKISPIGVDARMYTDVTYVDKLSGDELQTTFHKETGWRTVSEVLKIVGSTEDIIVKFGGKIGQTANNIINSFINYISK